MINNLEYYSAKTYYQTNNPNALIQGTGTIIASQGKYFLVTALHCMRLTDDKGIEILSPDWKKMRATIYMPTKEEEIVFKRFVDSDEENDWVILEIEKPNNGFDYQQGLILSSDYTMDETFVAYGFPKSIDDGMYLEFLPTNSRGKNWRLKEMVQGGSTKAITAEKGCSGMGLFHLVDGVYHCLGIINQTVPGGDFNVMKLISIKLMADFFPDIYHDKSTPVNELSDEDLEKYIQEEAKVEHTEISDRKLWEDFLSYMKLIEYDEAYKAIKQLWNRYPNDEWATLNLIKATSLVEPQELKTLQNIGLNLNYSTPQGVVFAARVFANSGFPQTAVDIWYSNALKFDDNELDTLFYVELLESPMREIVYKEYESVTEGKCVLYEDGLGNKHCLIVTNKTLMARTMLEKKKGDEFVLNITGEDRQVKIIAIFDRYYKLVHRALKDVVEQGGNEIMRPIMINENMTPKDVLKTIIEIAGIDTAVDPDVELQNNYNKQPSLILNSNNTDDLLWRYYRFLFTDFELTSCPKELKDPERFCYVTQDTRFVLDLSSLIVLFEKTMNGMYVPSRRFIVSNFLYEYIKEYQKRVGMHCSYDMCKVLQFGRIYRFSEDGLENVKKRYVALQKWMDDYCERLSSNKVLELDNYHKDTDLSLLFKHTMTLLIDDPSYALLTEDWYYIELMKTKLFLFDCDEFMSL